MKKDVNIYKPKQANIIKLKEYLQRKSEKEEKRFYKEFKEKKWQILN